MILPKSIYKKADISAPITPKSKKISDKEMDFAVAMGMGANAAGLRSLYVDRSLKRSDYPKKIRLPKNGIDIPGGKAKRLAYKYIYGKKSVPRVAAVTGIVGTGLAYGGLRYQRSLYNKSQKRRAKSLFEVRGAPIKKTAGGPGSSVSYNNTENINMDKMGVTLSSIVTIGKRALILKSDLVTRKTPLSPDDIRYIGQATYVISKLSSLLNDPAGDWIENPISVLLIDGEYHLMDGHHRWLAAKRLHIPIIYAKVWEMSHSQLRSLFEMKKEAMRKTPKSVTLGIGGSAALGGLSYLKQKGENYASGDSGRRVNPYRVGLGAITGAGLGVGVAHALPKIKGMSKKMDTAHKKYEEVADASKELMKKTEHSLKKLDDTANVVQNAAALRPMPGSRAARSSKTYRNTVKARAKNINAIRKSNNAPPKGQSRLKNWLSKRSTGKSAFSNRMLNKHGSFGKEEYTRPGRILTYGPKEPTQPGQGIKFRNVREYDHYKKDNNLGSISKGVAGATLGAGVALIPKFHGKTPKGTAIRMGAGALAGAGLSAPFISRGRQEKRTGKVSYDDPHGIMNNSLKKDPKQKTD